MPESQSDELLMGALKRGETHSLRMLIERWDTRLRGFIYRYLQDESVARDLVQETFVKVYQNRGRYDESRTFSTWMFGIAANLCRNHQRWLVRHAESPLEQAPEALDPETPVNCVDREEAYKEVMDSIQKLSHIYRVTVLLYYYEDRSYADIADVLGCSVRSVESRLYRARRLLAKCLGLNSPADLRQSRHEQSRIRNVSSHLLCR